MILKVLHTLNYVEINTKKALEDALKAIKKLVIQAQYGSK